MIWIVTYKATPRTTPAVVSVTLKGFARRCLRTTNLKRLSKRAQNLTGRSGLRQGHQEAQQLGLERLRGESVAAGIEEFEHRLILDPQGGEGRGGFVFLQEIVVVGVK